MTWSGTFEAAWRASVAEHAARPFLAFDDLEGGVARWTYGEFGDLVEAVAAGLRARGAGPRPLGAVHLALPNSPAFLACWLAAMRLGAVLVPSDPRATPPELAEAARRTRPVVAVVLEGAGAAYREAAPGVEVVEVRATDVELRGLRGDGRCTTPPPAAEDHAVTMFTSGTTSAPKGVVLTQANYLFAGRTMATAADVAPADRCLVVLPLFHANAQYYSLAAAIVRGASVVLAARFSASGFVGLARRHEATHASLFAAPVRMVLARTPDGEEPARLRHCWYAQNLTRAQHDRASELLGCRPRQLYGMTETLPAVVTSPVEGGRPDAMGHPTAGCRVDLLDPATRRPASPGAVGELVVRGRRGFELFAGYLDDAETTSRAFLGDGFLTADLARVGSDGQLEFAGRTGDVLKVSGENVSTVEVEAVIAEHPEVEDVAVVGAADPVRDEVPVAHVVGTAPPDVLAAWCEERLAPSKRPRSFVYHDRLPRTAVGKVRKIELTAT